MPESNDYLYALTPSLSLVFLALVLCVCWFFRRSEHFFLWLCSSYLLTALSLSMRSVLTLEKIREHIILISLTFLIGAWCLSKSFATRRNISTNNRVALLIGALTITSSLYFSFVDNNIEARLHAFSIGVCLILLLPVPEAFKKETSNEWLDRALLWCYLTFSLFTGARPWLVSIFSKSGLDNALEVNSGYWVTTLLSNLFFGLIFTVLIFAISIKEIVFELRRDRDQDALTKILNRRAFHEMANRRLGDKRLYPMAILAGDIDHFKKINDNWGHDRGDQVLQLVSACLQKNVRNQDLVARFGGEEFVLLLTRIDLQGAELVAQRIRADIRSEKNILSLGTNITISFGVTSIADPSQLCGALKQADELLYSAKNSGRDRVHVEGRFYPDINFEHTLPAQKAYFLEPQ